MGRARHLVAAQPGVFGFVLVVLLFLGLHFPGLGKPGLWDPWEMDRAHIARQMVGPLRVLVVEPRKTDQPLGAAARWLSARYGDNLLVATPGLKPGVRPTTGKLLDSAQNLLQHQIFHVIVVDTAITVTDPRSHSQMETLVEWLEPVRAKNPGAQLLLLGPGTDTAADSDWVAAFRRTAGDVLTELRGRALIGKGWGKPGPFGRDLAQTLRAAAKGGYQPVFGLSTPTAATFLERGFWQAAEKRNLDQRFSRTVPRPVSDALAATLPLTSLPVLAWPRGAQQRAVFDDFASGTHTATPASAAATQALEAAVDADMGLPLLRAQFKRDGAAYTVAPLDYWLMAASYARLGFSELSSRLPAFLVSLLVLLILFQTVRQTWGPTAATLAGIVLSTTPLFFAQARSVAGEPTHMLALMMALAALIHMARQDRLSRGAIATLLGAATIAFLAQGIFGLILLSGITLSYALLAGSRRLEVWFPAVLMLGLTAGLGFVVWSANETWSFWSHFELDSPLFNWNLSQADRSVRFNFDILIRQIGFGAIPWALLLPFGLGFMVSEKVRAGDRPALLVLLTFMVVYVLQSLVLKAHNHLVFPAIPAGAIAVALLLERVLRGEGLGAVTGVVGGLLTLVLLKNIGKTPEPLTTWLTTDPPLGGSEAESHYPEALALPGSLRAAVAFMSVIVLLYAARLASRARLIASFFTRKRPAAIAITVGLLGLALMFLGGLESQLAGAFATRSGQRLELIHRLFVRGVFYWRPETWGLLTLLGGLGALLLGLHTRLVPLALGWARTWLLAPFVVRTLSVMASLGAVLWANGLTQEITAGLPWLGLAWVLGLAAGRIVGRRPLMGLSVGFGLLTVAGLAHVLIAVNSTPMSRPAPRGLLILSALGVLGYALPFALHRLSPPLHRGLRRGVGAIAPLLGRLRQSPRVGVIALALSAVALLLSLLGLDTATQAASATLQSPFLWIGLILTLVAWRRGGLNPALLTAASALTVVAVHALILAEEPLSAVGAGAALPPALDGARRLLFVTLTALELTAAFILNALVGRLPRGSERFYAAHVALIVGLLGLALWLTWTLGIFPHDGFVAWASWRSPAFVVGLGLSGALLAIYLWARAAGRAPVDPLWIYGGLALGLAVALGGATAQLILESKLTQVDFLIIPKPRPIEAFGLRNQGFAIGALFIAAGLAALNMLWQRARASATLTWSLFAATGVVTVAVLTTALARKWLQLEPAVQLPDAEPYLPYLFGGSRRTQAMAALVFAGGGLFVAARFRLILARLRQPTTARAALLATGAGLLGLVLVALFAALPARLLAGLFGVVLLTGAALALNRHPARVERRLSLFRQPGRAIRSGALLCGGLAAAWLGGWVGVAALLGPLLAWGLGRLPLSRSLSDAAPPSALMARGALQLTIASLAFLIPVALLAIAGPAPALASHLLVHAFVLWIVLLLLLGLVVALRVGLGLADILERLALVSPAAWIFGLALVVDVAVLHRQGLPTGLGRLGVMVAVLGLVALGLNGIARAIPPLRVFELLERPRVFVVATIVTASGFAWAYNQTLLTKLSFHVSQKHILESVQTALGEGVDPAGHLFQYGLGASGGSTQNFYTNTIPEVRDRAAAVTALLGERDVVLQTTVAGAATPSYRLAAGFSAANDTDGDGHRDWAAVAGVADGFDANAHWLEDTRQHFRPNQWTGYRLYDVEGWAWTVTGNTATRISWDPASALPPARLTARKQTRDGPRLDPYPSLRNQYTVDHPEAADHHATAMAQVRRFFLLPKVGDHAPAYDDKGSFSDLNHAFRERSKGRHLNVLDDRSSRILLATNWLKPGESDHNWLAKEVLTPDAFLKQVEAGDIRDHNASKPLDGVLNWDDKLLLLGWSMDPWAVSKGKTFTLRIYFRVKASLKSSMKLFLHLDRAGHRIHTDHWPNAVSHGPKGKYCIGCFQTNHWLPGDIVVDEYTRDVPFGAPSGETEIWMGIFNPQGDKRLPIKTWDKQVIKYGGSDNRARIGTFVVR